MLEDAALVAFESEEVIAAQFLSDESRALLLAVHCVSGDYRVGWQVELAQERLERGDLVALLFNRDLVECQPQVVCDSREQLERLAVVIERDHAVAARRLGVAERGFSALTFRDNLQTIGELASLCDEYIDKAAPWKLAKNPDEAPKLKTVLNTAARALRLLAVSLYPFMPQTTEQLTRQLGYHFDFSKAIPASAYQWDSPVTDLAIAKGAPLFPRIEIAADTKSATAKDATKAQKDSSKKVGSRKSTPKKVASSSTKLRSKVSTSQKRKPSQNT